MRRRHNRQIHRCTILNGGYRKLNQAPYLVKKGLRLFDKVEYKGTECFITGRRSNGSFSIKDIEGNVLSNGVSYKKLRFLAISQHCLTSKKRNAPFPHPAKAGSIHG